MSSRPRLDSTSSVTASFSADPALLAQARAYAATSDQSFSQFVRAALRDAMAAPKQRNFSATVAGVLSAAPPSQPWDNYQGVPLSGPLTETAAFLNDVEAQETVAHDLLLASRTSEEFSGDLTDRAIRWARRALAGGGASAPYLLAKGLTHRGGVLLGLGLRSLGEADIREAMTLLNDLADNCPEEAGRDYALLSLQSLSNGLADAGVALEGSVG
jgi:hypothetical protein